METPVPPLPPLLGRLGWLSIGTCAALAAVLGFVLPILPGLPFAVLAGLCFANVFPGMHDRLARVPAMRGAMDRWARARGGPVRVQLTTALGLSILGLVETARLATAAIARRR